jgi:hypothetical protein
MGNIQYQRIRVFSLTRSPIHAQEGRPVLVAQLIGQPRENFRDSYLRLAALFGCSVASVPGNIGQNIGHLRQSFNVHALLFGH